MTRSRTAEQGHPSAEEAGRRLFAYRVKGDAAKVLADWKLPRGAAVAIIPADQDADARLREAAGSRITRYRELLPEAGEGPASEADTPGISGRAFEPDARARALLRGVEIAEADLAAAGGAFDLAQVQRLMRISRQGIDKRVQEGSLLAVPGPGNRRRYPTIQFNADGTILEGLKAVQAALDFGSPWAVLNFLVSVDDDLGGERPVDLLRRGEVDRILEAARRVGIQGA